MKEIITQAKKRGAEQAELFALESRAQTVSFENGALKSVEQAESRGGALRLVHGGRMGFATTSNFDQADDWVRSAVETCRFGEPCPFEFAAPAPMSPIPTLDSRVASLSAEEMIQIGTQTIARLKEYDSAILSFCTVGKTRQTVSIFTSVGFEGTYERTLFHFYVGGQLIEGKNFLECHDGIDQIHFDFDPGSYVSNVIDSFRHGRKNVPARSGPATVVLTPRALSDILLALEKGLNGKNVAKKTSPLAGKLQRKILDERITLHDDGTLAGASNTAPFDDEGTPTQHTLLIERGVLKNYLLDLRSAQDLNMNPTGNAARIRRLYFSKIYTELPAPSTTSLILKGGERQFDEILDSLDDAVMIDQLIGLSMGTQLSGDFSGNIALGYKIENGKIAGRVKDCMLAGNIYELLGEKHLVELSQDQRWIAGAHGGTHLLPHLVLRHASLSAK